MKKLLAVVAITAIATNVSAANFDWYGFAKGNNLRSAQMNDDHSPYFATQEPTAGYSDYDDLTQSTLSFRDSRFGFTSDNGSKVKATIEFDLAGETGNTAGVAKSSTGVLRVRQANLRYAVSGNGTVNFGKKWSAFAGLTPHTMAVTQVGFNQGNNAFIGTALGYTHGMGDLAFTFELGSSDQDNSQASTGFNYVSSPSMVLRADYKVEAHKFGFAYAMATKDLENTVSAKGNADITAMKIFYSGDFGMTNVRFEYTDGTNYTSTGMLGKQSEGALIGKYVANSDPEDAKETGMFVSAKHNFGAWALYGRYGVSEIANPEDFLEVNKVAKNVATGLGATFDVDTNVVVYGEYTMVTSSYLDAAGASDTTDSDGSVIDLGMMYKF